MMICIQHYTLFSLTFLALSAFGVTYGWQLQTSIMMFCTALKRKDYLSQPTAFTLFCCQFVFLPRLQASLDSFTSGWNNHPLRTESNRSPDQLWEIGLLQIPVTPPVQSEVF